MAYKMIAFETIVIKEVRRFTRIWVQTLVPPAINIALYFVVFLLFFFIGHHAIDNIR